MVPLGEPVPDKKNRPNVKAFHVFTVPVLSEGRESALAIIVREDNNGHFYHDWGMNKEMAHLAAGPSVSGTGIPAIAGGPLDSIVAQLMDDWGPPMPKVIFLSDIGRSGDLYRAQALRCGHWDYPGFEGGFEVTPTVLREMKAHFDDGAKGYEVPLNVEHDDERPAGWVKSVELSSDGTALFALFEITDADARRRVDERESGVRVERAGLRVVRPGGQAREAGFRGVGADQSPLHQADAPDRAGADQFVGLWERGRGKGERRRLWPGRDGSYGRRQHDDFGTGANGP